MSTEEAEDEVHLHANGGQQQAATSPNIPSTLIQCDSGRKTKTFCF